MNIFKRREKNPVAIRTFWGDDDPDPVEIPAKDLCFGRTEPLEGILTSYGTGDPVTPTIVAAPYLNTFSAFCDSSSIRRDSRNVHFLPCPHPGLASPTFYTSSSAPSFSLVGRSLGTGLVERTLGTGRWEHVAFVGVHPDQHSTLYCSADDAWYILETLRARGHIKRAFHYPNPLDVKPNYQYPEIGPIL